MFTDAFSGSRRQVAMIVRLVAEGFRQSEEFVQPTNGQVSAEARLDAVLKKRVSELEYHLRSFLG